MVGLQSKASFISTLRTLPAQRQSIAPVPPESYDEGLSASGVLNNRGGPLSKGMSMQSPVVPRSGTFPQEATLLQQTSTRGFGDDTSDAEQLTTGRRQHTNTTVSSGAASPDGRTLPSALSTPPSAPLAPTSLSSNDPPHVQSHNGHNGQGHQGHHHHNRHHHHTSWSSILADANLPVEAVDTYVEAFEANDMPPPTELGVLQHGIDHELLIALGVTSIGHRTRIISTCKALAAANISSGPFGAVPFAHRQATLHARGANTFAQDGDASPQRAMFPHIYRRDFEEQQRAGGLGEEGSEGSGIDEVGVQVQSLEGSFASRGSSHEQQQRRGSGKHVSLTDPLLARAASGHKSVKSGKSVDKKGSINASKRTLSSASSSSSSSSGRSSPSSDASSAVIVRLLITDENRVHEFVFRAPESHHSPGYTWVDLVGRDPRRLQFRDHLSQLVKDYHFAEPLLLDIDLTLALPQMISCPNEPDQFLIILRVAAESSGGIEEDSLHLLTNRIMIAVHLGTNTIVSIHRRDSSFMASLRETWKQSYMDKPLGALLCRILEDGLLSYVDAIHDSESLLDEYEALMLKHSVGGTGSGGSGGSQSAHHHHHHQQSTRRTLSVASQEEDNATSWWSIKNICEGIFGATNRNRAPSTLHHQAPQSGFAGMNNAQAALRLRNKEYQFDMLDSSSFSRQRMNQLLYHLHRRCSVYNRMLTLTQTTLEVSYSTLQLANSDYAEQVGRSCGELAMKAETLHDNCQNLLNLHLSLVSFRTNELMNLLTVYSAVFIPITFICSVYGMNFVNMPELELFYGYYYCVAVMAGMVLGILVWFRRKGFI
jgi:Mg2+ and Co2+ transporter CorA